MLSRDSGLPLDTRNTVVTSGERFLKTNLLEKDYPQLSARPHGIWHHLLVDWDQVIQEILKEHGRGVRDESRRVLQYQLHYLNQAYWNLEPFVSHWVNLFSQWCDGLSEISDLRNAS